MKKIFKIVLTGGPCGGKTTALNMISSYFSSKYKVLCIPESSTELMMGGISPDVFTKRIEYMAYQTRLQMLKEEIYFQAATSLSLKDNKDIIILLDRGIMDIKAYMSESEFDEMLCRLGLSDNKILARYSVVFYLPSAAVDAPSFYNNLNNVIRRETRNEAALLDKKNHQAWINHDNFIKVDRYTDFDIKINRLIELVKHFLDN